MAVRDRIKEIRTVKASELLPHPLNWQDHPDEQRELMEECFAEIGNLDVVKVFETDKGLMLFDGHLRTDLLGDQEIRVAVLDLSEEEAMKALQIFDPLGALSKPNYEKAVALAQQTTFESEALNEMVDDLLKELREAVEEMDDDPEGSGGGEGPEKPKCPTCGQTLPDAD